MSEILSKSKRPIETLLLYKKQLWEFWAGICGKASLIIVTSVKHFMICKKKHTGKDRECDFVILNHHVLAN